MTWALGLPENMTDNELYELVRDHDSRCGCDGCKEHDNRLYDEGIR